MIAVKCVSKQVLISLSIGSYKDDVLCDVAPMHVSHILLGRPWQFDRHVTYDGYLNRYSFKLNGKLYKLHALTPHKVHEDHQRMSKSRADPKEKRSREKIRGMHDFLRTKNSRAREKR